MQNNNNNCVGTNNDTKLAMVDTSFWIYNVHPILSSGGGAYPAWGTWLGQPAYHTPTKFSRQCFCLNPQPPLLKQSKERSPSHESQPYYKSFLFQLQITKLFLLKMSISHITPYFSCKTVHNNQKGRIGCYK